jgi:hypothetical protein
MLEVRRAMRRERIFRDRTNPLEIYHDLELIERFRCNETSHVLSHFFCISLMSLFAEFPAFTIFEISCHALFLSSEVIDEEIFAFKITILFSYPSNNTTFALSVQFGFPFRILLYFQQPRIVTFKQPDLECLPAQSNKSVHYLSIEKLKRNYQG